MFNSASFFLFITWIASSCAANNIHTDMTIEELKSTFQVDKHHLVPEYEVIRLHHVRKRSIDPNLNTINNLIEDTSPKLSKLPPTNSKVSTQIKFEAFGKPLNLKLVRTEGLFKKGKLKIWTVQPNATAQHGLEYMELPESDEEIGEIYQDEENQAAVLLRNDKDHVLVEGSIGSDLVIRPVPARLHKHLNEEDLKPPVDDELFLDTDGELSSEVAIDTGLPIKRNNATTKTTPERTHIVYKRKFAEDDSMSDYAFMEPDHLAKRYRRSAAATNKTQNHSRTKREAPYTIYPEILVIVDYDGYRLHGGDNLQIKRYFVSFWNGVDLRYKLLKGPKVRISIAGIIISRGRDATPYLERNRVGRDAIDSAAALTDMGRYLFRERRLPVYDIAVAITKSDEQQHDVLSMQYVIKSTWQHWYDMCRRRKGGRCTKGTAGFAYVGGACVVNKRLEKVNSVAIIEDTGGFSGIIVAAHEVGHLLGAVHDGSPPPSYLGGPGAEKCQWTDGYIMSDLRHTERGFRWSSCSISSFHHFLNGDTATCLFNVPHEDDSLPRVLPGKLLSLDAQCRRDRGTSACFKDDRVCAQLFCFDAASGYCVAYRPAAEGSPCGDGQYCLNGRCVAEHENIIPDYTQNTPAYLRGNNQGRPLFNAGGEEQVYQSPEAPSPQPPNYYDYSTAPTPFNRYTSTQRPFYTTRKYFTTQPTQPQYKNNYYTTKSPYNFKNFGSFVTTKPTTRFNYFNNPSTSSYYQQQTQSTTNAYIRNYYQLRKQTTKNPYDFANFGKSSVSPYNINYNDNINNNYLKRSYNSASFYSDSSNVRNVTAIVSNRRLTK